MPRDAKRAAVRVLNRHSGSATLAWIILCILALGNFMLSRLGPTPPFSG